MYLITATLLVNLAAASGTNCDLATPPSMAGETQAHGVIIYVYPRNPDIDENYSGCQTRWFKDDSNFRKLSLAHYINGAVVAFDDINVDGKIAYHCQYSVGMPAGDNDQRCPGFEQTMTKSYQAECYSKAKLNASGYYGSVSAGCELK
jgi:hypothetical protein